LPKHSSASSKKAVKLNKIWKYINPDDSDCVDLDKPAAEPTASSAAAATVWKEKKKDYRSAKEGMAKLEKHITKTLDAKLHGLLTPLHFCSPSSFLSKLLQQQHY
jgi:hypothetical protein